MNKANKLMKIAYNEGLNIFQSRLTGFMDKATKEKFLGFSRWHFNTCSDGSKYGILVKDGKVESIEVYTY